MRKIIDDQYEIIREIKAGGFGTIYYGWDLTLDRPIAIKEIVQSLLGEKQYIDMFIDEAVNTARLNHPNIVQVYSLRKTPDDRVFIIMQFIEGVDLREVIDQFNQKGETIPKSMAVYIISEICKALEYAHNLKDRKSGQPLNIVHRDISPSNIMLTVEGSVKLIDFGIAKARNRIVQKTQTGFVKGKVAYMSPEQLEGKDATRQSDIFSLGTVFFEICTGNELFGGDSDFTIMRKIASGQVDLSPLDKLNLPQGFKGILQKALQKDLSQRYQSANEMYVDLYNLCREHFPGEPTSDLSRLVHGLHIRKEDQESVPKDSGEKIKTQILSTPPEPEPEPEPPKPKEPPKPAKEKEVPPKPKPPKFEEEAKTVIFDSSQTEDKAAAYSSDDEAKTVIRDIPPVNEKKKSAGPDMAEILGPLKKIDKRVWMYGGGGIAILILLFIIGSLIGGGGKSQSGPSGDYLVWINSVPEGAEVTINDQKYGKTPLQIKDIEPGEYSLKIEYPGASVIDTQFTLAENEEITFPNFLISRETYINSFPQGASIFVDNRDVGLTTPALVDIPIIDSVDIRLEHPNAGKEVQLKRFNVNTGTYTSDETYLWDYKIDPENKRPELTGRFLKEVKITSKPQGADVYLEGRDEPIGQTPSTMMIPFGECKLRLVKSGFEDKIRTVTIGEDFQGSLFYELYRQVAISAVSASEPSAGDINANIVKIESEGQVSQSSDKTPIDLLLTGVEHRIYFSKSGFADTSFVIGVNQAELKAVMRKKSDKVVSETIAREEQEDRNKAAVIFVFIDDKSRDPLEGVEIFAENKENKKRTHLGSTNEYGRLAVWLEPGKYNLSAMKDGYKSWDDGKTLKKGKEYKIEEKLKRK